MTQRRLLMLLVALDFVSKVVALLLLPEAHSVRSDAIFQFALQLNETGFGTWGRAYFGHVSLSDALAGTVGYLGLAIALIATRRRRLGLWRRGAIAVAAYLVVALPAL